LWRIERPGVSPSYLFGTIHVSDPRASDTAKRVVNRLDEIGVVATEVSFERADLRRMASGLSQAPGRFLSAQLALDEFAVITRLLAPLGFDASAVDRLSPFGAIAILTVRPQRDLPSMDIQLYHTAKGRALKTVGLESVEEQLASIGRLDERVLLEELRTALRAPEHFQTQIEARVRTYLNESIGTLAGKTTANPTNGVTTVLIDDRNTRMQSRAQSLVEGGAAFIAVGASHLAGDSGLLVGLERAGYMLTRIPLD
ncbi:MAG: TraB/GumN family protein, partial [Burkholderiales bacterium]